MIYDVHIRFVETGEVRVYQETFDPKYGPTDAAVEYMYADGNYACDCNRAIFFSDAGDGGDCDIACGDSAYSVDKIVEHGTDRVVYSEME